MIHTKHIMLGRNAEHMLSNIYRYILKYEDGNISDFFGALLYIENGDGSADFLVAERDLEDNKTFQSGIEGSVDIVFNKHAEYNIPAEGKEQYLSAFFARQHTTTVNINTQAGSNSLHICIYAPLYEAKWANCVNSFLDAIEPLNGRVKVDIVMLSPDLAFLFNQGENDALKMQQYKDTAKESLDRFLEMKREYTCISHLISMQNCNSAGISLDLNEELFGRIFGEYALLTTYSYGSIFQNTPISPEDPHQIHSIGLSVLSFDKYYFIEYLLHKAYCAILKRERVNQEEVDINKVSKIAEKLLSGKVNIFSNLYDQFVKPKLALNVNDEEIISEFGKIWKEEIEKLTNEFQSFIDDKKNEDKDTDSQSLSLPEKCCVLAQLLGEDDERLKGNIFNLEQLVLDDCEIEMIDLFTSYNNKLLEEVVAPEATDENAAENDEWTDPDPLENYAVLSPDKETPVTSAAEHLAGIKGLKNSVKDKINYIRNKEEQLNSLQKQSVEIQESQKVLTEEGFLFQGKIYKLQNNVDEEPLAEDYEPKQNNTKEVDLRHQFTQIKDQGNLGSCASFATLSIYEHIHKKNKNEDIDLSEYFLYYNARAKKNETDSDSGSSLYHNIESMTQEGVCTEELCKYRCDSCSIRPSEEAYAEANSRKIKKALNVKKDIKDLKSALAEGYPVLISIKIFESFKPQAGFILLPSSDEKQMEKHGNHAMVICGYSDDKEIFIVRNSWGRSFGDKGYCYIPYSYISDPELLNNACIITEISEAELVVVGTIGKTSVIFDESNVEIRTAILRNLISEAKVALGRMKSELDQKTLQYYTLFESLGDNSARTCIKNGSINRLQREINMLEEKKRLLSTEREETIGNLDLNLSKIKIRLIISAVILVVYVLALLLLGIIFPVITVLCYILGGIGCPVSLISIIKNLIAMYRMKKERTEADRDYKERITNLATTIAGLQEEMKEIPLKMHIAGEMIDSIWKLSKNLRTKLYSMRSYIANLNGWYKEETKLPAMKPLARRPFMSLISNLKLDTYFINNINEITKELWLYELFTTKEYEIGEEAITDFKRRLKKELCLTLENAIKDFSIYNHITGTVKYDYVDDVHNNPQEFLPAMDRLSEVFTGLSATAIVGGYSSRTIFCKTANQHEQSLWRSLTLPHFINQPVLCNYISKDRIVMIHFEILGKDDIVQ